MTIDEVFKKWNESGNNEALKSDLLDKLLSENGLKLEAVKRKPELLALLHTAFESATPLIYEKATIIVSDMVDSKWL
jgi:hypothetical protein